MPELPEVETVMRGMEAALCGGRIARVDVRRKDLRVPFPKDLAKKLEGRTMAQFSRRAKYVLVRLDDGQVLVIHLGMSGRIQLVGSKESFSPDKHDHLVVTMQDGRRFALNDARRFGVVLLLPEDKIESHASFQSLGPEPLGNGFDAAYLEKKLKGRKTAVKVAIMDQRIVVGVGNIYACEALYQAGIDPRRAAGAVTRAELDRLVPAIRDVLARAIAAGGSTLRDYKQADGELGYFQHEFKVYGREGEPCPARGCGCKKTGGVQRMVQGGRSTFFCPVRQR